MVYIKVNLIEGTSIWNQYIFHLPTKQTINTYFIDLKNVFWCWIESGSSNSRQQKHLWPRSH